MKTSCMKVIFLFLIVFTIGVAASEPQKQPIGAIPPEIHIRIIQLEDERNLNGDELIGLLKHQTPAVRERAALAIGRIGDNRGADALIELFNQEQDIKVRAMAAFALGEMEDAKAVGRLMSAISPLLAPPHKRDEPPIVRARVCEALGKILSAGRLSKAPDLSAAINADTIAKQLPDPQAKLTADEKFLTSLAITSLMRLQVSVSVEPLTRQLKSTDAEIRAQAANALARLRQPIESAVPALIEALSDADADARANAARALGASKDARAVEPLVKLLGDKSDRVQVSAVRALAALNDNRAVEPLAALGEKLLPPRALNTGEPRGITPALGELLEIAAALGALKDERALPFLRRARRIGAAEVEVAIARFGEKEFFADLKDGLPQMAANDWRRATAFAQGVAEMGTPRAREVILKLLDPSFLDSFSAQALPGIFRAAAKLKVENLSPILRERLSHPDVIVRSTAAALLADSPEDKNLAALIEALAQAKNDPSNDARLAILTAISKHKKPEAPNAPNMPNIMDAIKTALSDQDHLARRHAVDLLKQMGAGDFNDRIGSVQTGHDKSFYQRVAGRLNEKVTATIFTSKGEIVIELFPQDAPITVDSFVTLARRDFFNEVAFHRVAPNFVIQGGDPRGDGEGGPGYQIRCEINTRPYTRGAVGMALSGKDTGGSQFFITHSPQPHLDGGYAVFGQVTDGMDVVDRISRGDVILGVEISEGR
jgi:cyclophilin family peptidyl-prolyl cis-trans isomerase/HEAT repeat protein